MSELTTPTIDQRLFDEITQATIDPIKLELMRLTLATVVPIGIDNLHKIGGPDDYHLEDIRRRCQELYDGKFQDAANIQYGGPYTAEQMALLCDMVTILAFQAGGVSVLGLHFEATPEPPQHERGLL